MRKIMIVACLALWGCGGAADVSVSQNQNNNQQQNQSSSASSAAEADPCEDCTGTVKEVTECLAADGMLPEDCA